MAVGSIADLHRTPYITKECLERVHDRRPAIVLLDVLKSLAADLFRHLRFVEQFAQRRRELRRIAVKKAAVRTQHLPLENSTPCVDERRYRVIPPFEQRDAQALIARGHDERT